MKIKLGATIPTVQYGNLQPEFEVEAPTIELGLAEIEPHIQALWDKYGEKPLNKATGKRLKAFVGGEIDYDDVSHTYTWDGVTYLSGSQYANSFRKPFDKQKIAQAMASKINADPAQIIAMWDLKSKASTEFGNSIHSALQLHEQYNGLATQLNKTTHSHDHPVIKHAVDSFLEAHKDERVISEALIVDHQAKRAGQIDRLLIVKRKVCRIQDFKTNADIEKELPHYWKQLEFYGSIMVAAGWEVEGYDIFHYTGEWKEYSRDFQES